MTPPPNPVTEAAQKATILAILTALLILATARSLATHQGNLQALHLTFPRPEARITPIQRVRFVVTRLATYSGGGKGFARIAHVVVSLVGILGMFSAVIGALLGPWLADTADDSLDDERFAYWVCEAEDDDDCGACPVFREDKYAAVRLFELL